MKLDNGLGLVFGSLGLLGLAGFASSRAQGSSAREPLLNYSRMTPRELENLRVIQEAGIRRRRDVIARYEADAAQDPIHRRTNLGLAACQRDPLVWHEEELAHLDAEQRRRGIR